MKNSPIGKFLPKVRELEFDESEEGFGEIIKRFAKKVEGDGQRIRQDSKAFTEDEIRLRDMIERDRRPEK